MSLFDMDRAIKDHFKFSRISTLHNLRTSDLFHIVPGLLKLK